MVSNGVWKTLLQRKLILELTKLAGIFILLNMVFTVLGILLAPSNLLAILRPFETILPHVLILLAFSLLCGTVALIGMKVFTKKFNLLLAGTCVTFTVLLDLDHLPAFLDISQPPRPAHSLIFLATLCIAIWILFRHRKDIISITVSSFFIHLAIDRPYYPLLAPASFTIFEFQNSVSIGLGVIAIVAAIIAGYLSLKE